MEQEIAAAQEKARREAEERALAAQRERERIEREERERQIREQQERERREKAVPTTKVGGSGVRGVRGTRASMRGTARGTRGGLSICVLSFIIAIPVDSFICYSAHSASDPRALVGWK